MHVEDKTAKELAGVVITRGGTCRYTLCYEDSTNIRVASHYQGNATLHTVEYVNGKLKSGAWCIVNTTTQDKKANTMSSNERYAQTPIAKPTLIYGQNIEDFKEEDYLRAIRRLQSKIDSYSDIRDSSKVLKIVEKLKTDLKALTALFDKA